MRAGSPEKRRGRTAFTIIELLFVMAFIAVLAALVAVGTARYVQNQRIKNVERVLRTLNSALQRQWSTVSDVARKTMKSQGIPQPVLNLADGNAERAQVIMLKLYIKQAFPMTFDEAYQGAQITDPSGSVLWSLPPLATFRNTLQAQGVAGTTSATASAESGVLLLLALERNGVLKREDLGSAAIGQLTVGAGGSLDFLRDEWGKGLVFSRWPYASDQLKPAGPQPPPSGRNGNDSGDPNGLLADINWWSGPSMNYNGLTFAQSFHPQPYHPSAPVAAGPSPPAGTPMSYALVPIIVSGGPDGVLGIDPVSFAPTSSTDVVDNIYSSNLPPQY